MPRFRHLVERCRAPVTRRPPRGEVDPQHEPLPVLVLSFASITLLLSFLTFRAATFPGGP
jgi:hypothetical protein